jgi:hypothetical protein
MNTFLNVVAVVAAIVGGGRRAALLRRPRPGMTWPVLTFLEA